MKQILPFLSILLSTSTFAAGNEQPLTGCWEAFIERGGNTVDMCIRYDLVSLTVFYPNGKAAGDENVCQQRGKIEHTPKNELSITLSEGQCGGGRIIGAGAMQCKVFGETMGCLIDDHIEAIFEHRK